MKMSYMRAWTLIQVMNRSFRRPLVASSRGGASRGGAALTPTGRRALRLYEKIEASAARAAAAHWNTLASLLRP